MSHFQIRTDTSSLAAKREARQRKKRRQMLIGVGVVAALVVVGLAAAIALRPSPPAATAEPPIAEAQPPQAAVEPAVATRDHTGPLLLEDDGKTLWASPTSGPAIDLSGLPAGCELFLAFRPADLLATDEGQKLLASLGPWGEQGRQYIEQQAGLPWSDIAQLNVGLRAGRDFSIDAAMVVTPKPDASVRSSGETYPVPGRSGTYVVASPVMLEEIKQLEGGPPPLRREVESILDTTDTDRLLTLVATPTFLFDDGRRMWQGAAAGLHDPVFAMLPDSTRCVALSLNLEENFFAEVRVTSTLDVRPRQFAGRLADTVAAWPTQIERAIADVRVSPYAAAVVARLPAMLRAMSRYQRVGVDSDQAVLRVYLPAAAGHSLLMAGELLLSERMAGDSRGAAPAATAGSPPQSIKDRLQMRTSLSFTRDTLETAVNLLSQDIGVDIVLLGGDLQLDGITKNQSFGVDEQDLPAADILVSVLRLTNPDKTASGPADPRQKLIYVLGKHPTSGEPAVLVTTRAQATKRGDQLPAVFQP